MLLGDHRAAIGCQSIALSRIPRGGRIQSLPARVSRIRAGRGYQHEGSEQYFLRAQVTLLHRLRTLSSPMDLLKRIAAIAAFACFSRGALAQPVQQPLPAGDAQILIVNALLGGLTAGTWRAVTKRPLLAGFTRGALAGATVYAGKRMIGSGKPSGWWAGRQLAALASSEVVNAGKGLPVLQTVVIPLGPVRLHVNRAKRKVSPRLDLASAMSVAYSLTQPGARFALEESLTTGAVVFLKTENSNQIGTNVAGVLSLSELVPDGNFPPLESKRSVLSHELVHATQYDFAITAWSDAAQEAAARAFPWARTVTKYLDVNVAFPLQLVANGMIEYHRRPWEREANSIVP